jgi:flagellar basal-body rod protein FlgF
MENTSYIGLSRQIALGRQLDMVANNVANMNSSGFKSERAIFEEFLVKTDNRKKLSYVQDRGLWRDTQEGPMQRTGNPYDLGIQGEAYFVVGTTDGPRYTQNGRFQLDGEGTLVTQSGFPVLDENSDPIVIDPLDGDITISSEGAIIGELGELARLQLVSFENEQELLKIGDSLYNSQQDPQVPEGVQVVQGMFEGSNVKGVVEMTRMMDVTRAYTSTANMLQSNHDLQRRAVERLGEVVTA